MSNTESDHIGKNTLAWLNERSPYPGHVIDQDRLNACLQPIFEAWGIGGEPDRTLIVEARDRWRGFREQVHQAVVEVVSIDRLAEIINIATPIILSLIEQRPSGGEIRIWTCGVGRPIDSHLLALHAHALIAESGKTITLRVMGTAISEDDLSAKLVLDADEIKLVPEPLRERYLVPSLNGGHEFVGELRRCVVVARHDPFSDFEFRDVDLTVWRGRQGFLEERAQNRLLSCLRASLSVGGFLLLNRDDTPAPRYDSLRKDERFSPSAVYQRVHENGLTEAPRSSAQSADASSLASSYDGVLLARDLSLIHLFGDAHIWLRHHGVDTNEAFEQQLSGPLRADLEAAFDVASKSNGVTCVRLNWSSRESDFGSALHWVICINGADASADKFLVLVAKADDALLDGDLPALVPQAGGKAELFGETISVAEPQVALAAAKRALETVISELGAANSELRYANLEMQASNEQLHAVNEELQAVNQEFHDKVTELSQVSADLSNLIRSTDIATIFVDTELCVRLYTPGTERFYALKPSDLGRGLADFRPLFDGPAVELDASRVLISGETIETRVDFEDGSAYLRRTSAYRGPGRGVAGLTVSFVDVSALVIANRELVSAAQRLRAIYHLVPSALWVLDWQGVIDGIGELRARGISDVAAYLARHKDACDAFVTAMKVMDVNGRAVEMLSAADEASARDLLSRALNGPAARDAVLCAIAEYARGVETHKGDTAIDLPNATTDHLLLSWAFPDAKSSASVVYVSAIDFRDRKHAEDALRASELRQRTLINAIDDCGFALRVVDELGGIRYRNRRSLQILNGQVDTPLDILAKAQGSVAEELRIDALPSRDETRRLSLTLGDGRFLDVLAMRYRDVDGDECRLEMLRDVSAERRLIEAQRIAATTFETQLAMLVADAAGNVVKANSAFRALSEERDSQSQSQRVDEMVFVPAEGLAGDQRSEQHFELPSSPWRGELRFRRRDGEDIPVWCMVSPVHDDCEDITHFVFSFSDISERKQNEAAMMRLALYDPLTRLPNRRFFLARLDTLVNEAVKRAEFGALLYVDLDSFKALNDSMGHDAGDELLQHVGRRLAASVRAGDVVARLGGDEFVVLLTGLGHELTGARDGARAVARKISQALQLGYALQAGDYQSGASIGVSIIGESKSTADQVLKQADLALYKAKAEGRHAIRFFEAALQYAYERRTDLDSRLRDAVRDGCFVLMYQPQYNRERTLIGAEALVRWRGPDGELVLPAEFIGHAEDSGLIVPIGDWVLETACRQLREWQRFDATRHLQLAVNISAKQFKHQDFVKRVETLIAESGADPNRLRFEITESVLLDDLQDAIKRITALRSIGVAFSIDDFGTGYSSLSYLRALPVDELKIDRSFVRDLNQRTEGMAIVRAIVAMARALQLQVLAEGVESEDEWRLLDEIGCDSYQGFLFGRPVASTQALLNSNERSLPQTASAPVALAA